MKMKKRKAVLKCRPNEVVEVKGRKDLAALLELLLWKDYIVEVADYNIGETAKQIIVNTIAKKIMID